MPYMTNYEYTCRDCGQESLIKKAASEFDSMERVAYFLKECLA